MEEINHSYGMGVLLIVSFVSKIVATYILIVTSICEILFADLNTLMLRQKEWYF